jgi:RNA polymerase primary sigma factor
VSVQPQISRRAPPKWAPRSPTDGNETRAPTRAGLHSDLAEDRRLTVAAKAGDIEARGELVASLQPMIGNFARRYRHSGISQVELTQEGAVGVLRALKRYDPTRGVPFWAYAGWWVRQAMQQLVAELTRPVVLSDRAARHLARIKRAQHEHSQRYGKEPTDSKLAAETGLDRTHVQVLLGAERPARALNAPASRDSTTNATLVDLLADPVAEDDFDRVPRPLAVEELPSLFRKLSERERVVLRARYGLNGHIVTLRDLGARLGITAERVRQIENRALAKLRDAATAEAGDIKQRKCHGRRERTAQPITHPNRKLRA